jgi:hypothetical protein
MPQVEDLRVRRGGEDGDPVTQQIGPMTSWVSGPVLNVEEDSRATASAYPLLPFTGVSDRKGTSDM